MADEQEGKPHVTVKFDPVPDAGLVTRIETNNNEHGGGWSKIVTYKDELGNSMTIEDSGDQRGSGSSYRDISVTCRNGAVVPETKHAGLNQALAEGFWFKGWFSVQDHDFGDAKDNPLLQACSVAKPPKPRKR